MKVKSLFILFFVAAHPFLSFSQGLTYEQQKRLQQYFDTNAKFYGVSQKVLENVMSEHKDFFGKYADALVAVDILNKVANAQDAQALESAILFAEGKIVDKILPGLGSVLSWASWAKTGMEVLRDFVINPALLNYAIDSYCNNRKAFGPDDALVNIYSWGNIEQQLLGEFRKEYGDYVFKEIKPSGLILLPKWKSRFDKFVLSWFENQYQTRKLKELQKKAREKLKTNQKLIEEESDLIKLWIDQAMEQPVSLSIIPEEITLKTSESVTFNVQATMPDGSVKTVTGEAMANPVFYATDAGRFTITAAYNGLSAKAVVTVEKEPVDPQNIECNDPNAKVVWDSNTNKYICACKDYYKKDPNSGLCVPDVSVLVNSSDCAKDPHAKAEWDPVAEKVICSCVDFYKWDPAQNKCVPDIDKILANYDCSRYPNTQPKWDYASQRPYCDCLPGHSWDDNYTQCISDKDILLAQSDCSQYPNTHPVWDPVNNEVICDCLPGYQWDENYTKCLSEREIQLQNTNCAAYYPNSVPVWDYARNEVVCDCPAGFIWNNDGTACVRDVQSYLQNADCSGYPNTKPIWDPATQKVYCDCLPGYVWNSTNTGCEPDVQAQLQSVDCSLYPNSAPVWDPVDQMAKCGCISGYVWNSSYTACIEEQQAYAAYCDNIPHSHPVYDPGTGQVVCDCDPGYQWDPSYRNCVPVPQNNGSGLVDFMGMMIDIFAGNGSNPYNPSWPDPVNPGGGGDEPVKVQRSNCNDKLEEGGDTPEEHVIDLGTSFGRFQFDYNVHSIKDQIIIYQSGMVLFDTGCISGSSSVTIELKGYGSQIRVRVNPNCDGSSGTKWEFTVHCPGY